MTEFLIILMVLIAIVLVHVQFSLHYIVASYMKYTSFMTARAAAVNGNADLYRENLIGTPTNSRLSIIAAPLPGENGGYISPKQVSIPYKLFQWIPWIEKILMAQKSVSPIQNQGVAPIPPAYFDNEGGTAP